MGARFAKQIAGIFALLWMCVACTSAPSADPRQTVPYLASDKLAGRAPGSPGLETAGDYLANEFHAIGLQPLPQLHGYFQPFTMTLSSTVGPATNLLVNDKSLVLGTDFSPLAITSEGPFSGPLVFVGFGVSQNGYDDYAGMDVAGKVVLAMRQEPRDEKGKSRLADKGMIWSPSAYFNAKAKSAAQHGAVALLLVSPPSSGPEDSVGPFSASAGESSSSIPVMQISRRVADLLLATGNVGSLSDLQKAIDSTGKPKSMMLRDVEINGDVALKRSSAQIRNVVAYLPGSGEYADEFVVVGAHYDHLGLGQLGHTLGLPGSIYHGADDNASGVATVLEIAAQLSKAPPPPRSIIFVFFTAEEEGLIGSDWFVNHPPVPLEKIVAMLNMDMVGRLKDENVLVGGWGTAANFDSIVKSAIAGTPMHTQSFEKGGLGPSDHMSFALKKIPVLFLFTGLHADYHRPTDTADKINYVGIDEIASVGRKIVDAMAAMPRQTYDASSDSNSMMAFVAGHGGEKQAALGVVPDYASLDSKGGVPISGVGTASPAEIAGLHGGDVITDFAGKPMHNLQDLSDALAEASPGDKVTVKVLRDGKPIELHAILGQRKSE
jgi:Peptidase family M28/PDZ domain/PA domain